MKWTVLFFSLIFFFAPVFALKEHDFKKCHDAAFCRRGRALAQRARAAGDDWRSPYHLVPDTIKIEDGKAAFSAHVKSTLYPEITFLFEARIHHDGVARVRMDELGGIKKRYDEAAGWSLVGEPALSESITWVKSGKGIKATYGAKNEIAVKVEYSPLRVTLSRGGKEEIVLNGEGLLHMEHFRTKPEPPPETTSAEGAEPTLEQQDSPQVVMQAPKTSAWFEGEEEDGWWEETFKSWTDSKPKGLSFMPPP